MSKVLNKKALADVVSERCGITKKDALEIVNVVFEEVVNTLKEEGKVDISGFGKFEVKTRKARTGMNPKTKEVVEIPETKVPGFKPSKLLKDSIK